MVPPLQVNFAYKDLRKSLHMNSLHEQQISSRC